jgi:hypothetical protein
MWLMTRHGFNSIVEKQSGEFHVWELVEKQSKSHLQ